MSEIAETYQKVGVKLATNLTVSPRREIGTNTPLIKLVPRATTLATECCAPGPLITCPSKKLRLNAVMVNTNAFTIIRITLPSVTGAPVTKRSRPVISAHTTTAKHKFPRKSSILIFVAGVGAHCMRFFRSPFAKTCMTVDTAKIMIERSE